MSGDLFRYTVSVSKDAAELVRAGKAVFSSGGVRALDGTLVEMAKPALLPTANTANTNPLSICAREIAQNRMALQSINGNLNVSIKQMQNITKSLESLTTIQALNWVNCALGVLNTSVSIAGTVLALQRIDGLSNQIGQIQYFLKETEARKRKEKVLTYLGYIRNDLDLLSSPDMSRSEMINVPDHISQIHAFLKTNIEALQDEMVEHMESSTAMIFSLVFAYSELIRIYTGRYFYFKSTIPSQYSEWLSVLTDIDSDDFRNLLKTYLELYCFNLSTEEKIKQFSGVIHAIRHQIGLMNQQIEVIQNLSYKEYLNMDQMIDDKIKRGKFTEVDGNLYIEMKTETTGFSALKRAFGFVRE